MRSRLTCLRGPVRAPRRSPGPSILRWHGGDLDGCSIGRHAAMHEAVALMFDALDGWLIASRGLVLRLRRARRHRHRSRGIRAAGRCLSIELKTDDRRRLSELIGSMDRRARLASRIARGRRLEPLTASRSGFVVADSRDEPPHGSRRSRPCLRGAFPADGRAMRALASPRRRGPSQRLSFLPTLQPRANLERQAAGRRRDARPTSGPVERESGSSRRANRPVRRT